MSGKANGDFDSNNKVNDDDLTMLLQQWNDDYSGNDLTNLLNFWNSVFVAKPDLPWTLNDNSILNIKQAVYGTTVALNVSGSNLTLKKSDMFFVTNSSSINVYDNIWIYANKTKGREVPQDDVINDLSFSILFTLDDESLNFNLALKDKDSNIKGSINIYQREPFPTRYNNQWNLEKINFKTYFANESQRENLLTDLSNSSIKIAIVDLGIQQYFSGNTNPVEISDFDNLDISLSRGFDHGNINNSWWPLELNHTHGTRCGSVAVSSGTKLYGTAPGITFVSLRMDLRGNSIAAALAYENNKIAIYNCSFGPVKGDTRANSAERAAVENGCLYGRYGSGCIYVYAAGNDGREGYVDDTTSMTYQLNLAETIVVGATNINNEKAYYSEAGANLLCVAPGGEIFLDTDASGIPVFDTSNTVIKTQGTSFACPGVAGICGVMLSLRPDLSWRDVKEIISQSCTKIDVVDTDWFINKVGRNYNINYGFGLIDFPTVISNTKAHVLLTNEYGFKINIDTEIDLTSDSSFSFTVDSLNNSNKINNNIYIADLSKNFIIQEFSIIFEELYEEGELDTLYAGVHELSTNLTVEDRYYKDYQMQPITMGRVVTFGSYRLDNYPIQSEFLKGEKVMVNDKTSTWTINLSDVNVNTPLKGKVSHVEFRGYHTINS